MKFFPGYSEPTTARTSTRFSILRVKSPPLRKEHRVKSKSMKPAARHRCMIYTASPEQQLPYVVSLLLEELRAGTRCVYMNNPGMVAAMRVHLANAGVDVEAEIDERTLILSSDPNHLVRGRFDTTAMLNHFAATVAEAEADGFLKLWVTGDMNWEFGDHKDFRELHAFERSSEELFHQHAMLNAVCQYHRDSLPPSALHDALRTHRTVYINETLFAVNPYFTPASAAPKNHIPADIDDLLERFHQHH